MVAYAAAATIYSYLIKIEQSYQIQKLRDMSAIV